MGCRSRRVPPRFLRSYFQRHPFKQQISREDQTVRRWIVALFRVHGGVLCFLLCRALFCVVRVHDTNTYWIRGCWCPRDVISAQQETAGTEVDSWQYPHKYSSGKYWHYMPRIMPKKVKLYHHIVIYLVKMYRKNAMILVTYSIHVYISLLT